MTSDLSTGHPEVTTADDAAIRATIDDYYLGWFDADGERMAKALHRELAKRGWRHRADGPFLDVDTFDSMTRAAAAGDGRQTDPSGRGYTVRIDDVDGDIATATVHSVPYVDYLHLIRTSEGWRIVNALWCPA